MKPLRIALSKGRIFDETLPLFAAAGIRPAEDPSSSRKLIIPGEPIGRGGPGSGPDDDVGGGPNGGPDGGGPVRPVDFLVVRASDVPAYVRHGGADLGVVGKDVLMEHGGEGLLEPLDLGIARCRLMVAGFPGTVLGAGAGGGRRFRVATKYAECARRHFAARHRQVEIIKLYGSMELAPLVGLADLIVDVVDTGATLAANGLEPLEHIADISSRLVVARASMKTRHADDRRAPRTPAPRSPRPRRPSRARTPLRKAEHEHHAPPGTHPPITASTCASSASELRSPTSLIDDVPVSAKAAATVTGCRSDVRAILDGSDDRVVVVVGPCSIHDPDAAREYAEGLARVRESLAGELCIVMRVYFEKPRTTIGWKGLINDPSMDNSFRINDGLEIARRLLADIAETGLPAGRRVPRPDQPAVHRRPRRLGRDRGAHDREPGPPRARLGAVLPGRVQERHGGLRADRRRRDRRGAHPHHFLSVTKEGGSAIFQTAGNRDCHLILRGGKAHANHDAASVDDACALLAKAGLPERVMIDCSHANSRKLHRRQGYVCRDICAQIEGRRRARRRRHAREQPRRGRAERRQPPADARAERHRRVSRVGRHGAAPRGPRRRGPDAPRALTAARPRALLGTGPG